MKTDIDWNNVDWSKYNGAIAHDLGATYYQVYRERLRRGLPSAPRGYPKDRPRAGAEYWESVDWWKRDVEIARELGVTRERVRQQRQKLTSTISTYRGVRFIGQAAHDFGGLVLD